MLGMNDAEMASAMGVRPDTVRQRRKGRTNMKAVHLERLVRLLAEQQAVMQETEQQLRSWLAQQPIDQN
jgi:hypothetical protein